MDNIFKTTLLCLFTSAGAMFGEGNNPVPDTPGSTPCRPSTALESQQEQRQGVIIPEALNPTILEIRRESLARALLNCPNAAVSDDITAYRQTDNKLQVLHALAAMYDAYKGIYGENPGRVEFLHFLDTEKNEKILTDTFKISMYQLYIAMEYSRYSAIVENHDCREWLNATLESIISEYTSDPKILHEHENRLAYLLNNNLEETIYTPLYSMIVEGNYNKNWINRHHNLFKHLIGNPWIAEGRGSGN